LGSQLGIFPSSVGAGIDYLALITVLALVISFIAFIALFFSMKRPDEVDKHSLAKYELHWTLIVLAIVVLFALTTISYLPYPYAHSDVKPTMYVDVQAQQFNWCLSPPPSWGTNCQADFQIPAGSIVMFYVRSLDVNHGFAVYTSGGEIVAQVQVMPDFNNSIMIPFTQPGDYYIRCLEFCGYGHYEMISQLNVTAS
jgi:cytochrome c oxidase subunit II